MATSRLILHLAIIYKCFLGVRVISQVFFIDSWSRHWDFSLPFSLSGERGGDPCNYSLFSLKEACIVACCVGQHQFGKIKCGRNPRGR